MEVSPDPLNWLEVVQRELTMDIVSDNSAIRMI